MEAKAIIDKLFTEFSSVEDGVKELWISLSRPAVSEKKFGEQYEYAVALIACHRMKLAGLGEGIAGSEIRISAVHGLSGVSEGETSLSFAGGSGTTSGVNAEYEKTVYGLQYLSLIAQCVIPITIA